MSIETKPCRDCGTDVMWVRSMSGHWQLYALDPVPFTDARPGIVRHRRRGWVDAGTAWPQPEQMLPRHWHPKRDSREPRHVSAVLDEFLNAYPRKRPSRKPRRSERA